MKDSTKLLISSSDDDDYTEAAPGWEQTFSWRLLHAAAFLIGGTTFIGGTAALFWPSTDASNFAAALLYTIGSCGFITVDLLEFFTFTTPAPLRANIAMSALGSAAYIVGSLGFLPSVASISSLVGVVGFIVGSALIAVSQAWKSARLSTSSDGTLSLATLRSNVSAVGVEANAGLGALCFLIGTAMYQTGPLAGPWYAAVLALWIVGSLYFTLGGTFLAYRHFVMGVT